MRVILILFGCVIMTACSTTEYAVETAKRIAPSPKSPSYDKGKYDDHSTYKVGGPYQIFGRWYHPNETFEFVEVGEASWYGPGFHGRQTANGEVFDRHAMTAAHRTLQMPSVVRVTNLRNGRSKVLRINDRGPFAKERVIDVSEHAAEALGFKKDGHAPVRIELLPEASREVARLADEGAGRRAQREIVLAAARGELDVTPPRITDALLAEAQQPEQHPSNDGAVGSPRPRPVAEIDEESGVFVQVGSFRVPENAARLQARLEAIAPARIVSAKVDDQTYYRVVVGPFVSHDEAEELLGTVRVAVLEGEPVPGVPG